MNTEELNAEKLGDDDHVEVLVEDLFIEEYEAPLTLPPDTASLHQGRFSKVTRPIRENATSLLGGIAAIGGLVLATLFFSARRRKVSGWQRMFLRLGLAR